VRRATPSTRIVRVRPEGPPFTYRAGQGTELGPAGSRILSPYSIASSPEEAAENGFLEFLIKLDAQGRWGEHFDPLHRGQPLRMRGPFGRFVFPDRPSERHFLFIAGGTGIAPLRAMIRHGRARAEGTFRLLYSARTPQDFAYKRELRGMARRRELELTLTATRGVHEGWRGERGRITQAQLAALIDDHATRCFVCGPATMVDEVPQMLRDLGIERSRIHVEEW
jgi:3-ketosteroid 9alpha-monooxygenase subunit B